MEFLASSMHIPREIELFRSMESLTHIENQMKIGKSTGIKVLFDKKINKRIIIKLNKIYRFLASRTINAILDYKKYDMFKNISLLSFPINGRIIQYCWHYGSFALMDQLSLEYTRAAGSFSISINTSSALYS